MALLLLSIERTGSGFRLRFDDNGNPCEFELGLDARNRYVGGIEDLCEHFTDRSNVYEAFDALTKFRNGEQVSFPVVVTEEGPGAWRFF